MYLIDREIRARLGELDIVCENPNQTFDSATQIQGCSIDLRIGDVLWVSTRTRRPIDLLSSKMLEANPRRYYRRHPLPEGQSFVLRPGRYVVAGTYEKFTIPTDCAGKIEGRSSFARLGLSVHCTGDFLNPGYRGHMTLQIVNNSPNSVRLYPYIPIAQLMLLKLSGPPDKLYGQAPDHKYMEDDGGPSYWWRDKLVKKLTARLGKINVTKEIQLEIIDRIGVQDAAVLDRLEKYVEEASVGSISNAMDVLDGFVQAEERREKVQQVTRWGVPALAVLLLGLVGRGLIDPPYGLSDWILWPTSVAAILAAILVVSRQPQVYITRSRLRAT